MRTLKNPLASVNTQHVVSIFDSYGQAFDQIDKHHCGYVWNDMPSNGSFYGDETRGSIAKGIVEGDKETAESAKRIMAGIKALDKGTVKRTRIKSPMGRASIGAYLSSDPMPCRRNKKEKTNTAPINIVVSTMSSGSIDADTLKARGVAIAAMVRKLVQHRPVNLYTFAAGKTGGLSSAYLVKFPTAPLDSYRLAYILSNQGVGRGLNFAYFNNAKEHALEAGHVVTQKYESEYAKGSVAWFDDRNSYTDRNSSAVVRDLEGLLGGEVLFIPASFASDPTLGQMVNAPIDWINQTVDLFK